MRRLTLDVVTETNVPNKIRAELVEWAQHFNCSARLISANGPGGHRLVEVTGSTIGLTALLFTYWGGSEDDVLTSLAGSKTVEPT